MPSPRVASILSTTSLLILTLFFLAAFSYEAVAQADLFVAVDAQKTALSASQNQLLTKIQQRATTAAVNVVRIADAPTLSERQQVMLNVFPGKRFAAQLQHVERRTANDFTWVGTPSDPLGSVVLTVQGTAVTGTIRTGKALYKIEPLGPGLHALIRVDESQFPPDHPPGYDEQEDRQKKEPNEDSSFSAKASTLHQSGVQASMQSNPVIELLVVYTEAAANATGSISGLIQTAISETNGSYQNSNISASVTLAHSAQVDYDESGNNYQHHVNRLQGTSDGDMDNVHGLRNQYDADIVILIVDDAGSCGLASAIEAIASTAFAVVWIDCATGNYSFGHEIGHLQGARHNPETDPTPTPYPYGHGYLYTPGGWRTVMAYNDPFNCPGGTCTRLQYWSNPDVSHPVSSIPMGTAADEDNARVLDETASTVASFRPLPVSASISGPGCVVEDEQATWTAYPLYGFTPYSYEWEYYIECGAGGGSLFGPPDECGVWHYGSAAQQFVYTPTSTNDLRVRLTVTDDIDDSDTETKFVIVEEDGPNACNNPRMASASASLAAADGAIATSVPTDYALSANYPNPFNPTTEIRFALPEAAQVHLVVYDALGREVARLMDGAIEAGHHRATFDASALPSGVYLYRLTAGDFIETRRMVLMK